MGNRVIILFFLILALSFLFTAVSLALLSIRRKKSLRMGLPVWAVLFFSVTLPLNMGNSPLDLLLYDDWSGGVRIEILLNREEAAEFTVSPSVRTAAEHTAALFSAVWITSAAASFSYGMASYFNHVHFLTKRSKICRDARINTIFEGAAAKAGLRRSVSLRVMDDGLKISPCACGLLSQSVFVGEDILREYSDEWLELVFLHELIHVQRNDPLLKLLTLFITSLHGFLPAAKAVRKSVQEDCEYLCDLAVLRCEGDHMRSVYMAMILDAAERNIRERETDLLSSASSAGTFLLNRYRNMQNRKNNKKPYRYVLPVFLCGLVCNILLMSAADLPNLKNPGVDISDHLLRRALCEYFGLEDSEQLTAAHMDTVYALSYEIADHRHLTDDAKLRFTRRIVINEGLFPTEKGYLPPVLPENASQASCGILPCAIRREAFDPTVYPTEFYDFCENMPETSPCSTDVPVYLLKPDISDDRYAFYLSSIGSSPVYTVWLLADKTANLHDLTLFTGLRTFGISKIYDPIGYDLSEETGFAVIYETIPEKRPTEH